MYKIYTNSNIARIDKMTIEAGTPSLQLMENAAKAVAYKLTQSFIQKGDEVVVFAGPGNNGGDALAIARLLEQNQNHVTLYSYTGRQGHRSPDCQANFDRLPEDVEVHVDEFDIDSLDFDHVIDGLFGTGLTCPIEGKFAQLIDAINSENDCYQVYSIDLPSGIYGENQVSPSTIRAHYTFAFQLPKISFFLEETGRYIGEYDYHLNIGLSQDAIDKTPTPYVLFDASDCDSIIKQFNRYDSKFDHGRAMIFAGSYGMMGAAVLAARACMRSGIGLLTMGIPACGYDIMQISVPEAMAAVMGEKTLEWDKSQLKQVEALAVGPGIGRSEQAKFFVRKLVEYATEEDLPLVVDADGLFHLGELLNEGIKLPEKTVITPHAGEFDRLTRKHATRLDRIQTAFTFAAQYNVVVHLKGAFSATITPEGECYINETGAAGMGTAGSGDVLTGIITGLLAQGYPTTIATLFAAAIHGSAGKNAEEELSERSMTALDILNYIR